MSDSYPPLKVGLIGVGQHAQQILIPAIDQLSSILRLTALATAHEETARIARERYRLPCCVGHEALIANPSVEAVAIASHDHEAHALAALAAGKHVFTETPGIQTVAGAQRIRSCSGERRLTYQVGSCLRYAPPYRKMQALLREWRAAEPGPRAFDASYYGPVGHIYNLLLFLNGDVERGATARPASVLGLRAPDGSAAITLLRFANGDIGCVRMANFHNWTPPQEQVSVTHLTGKLVAEDGRFVRFHRTPAAKAAHPRDLSFDHAEGLLFQSTYSLPYGKNAQLYMRGYVPELADFVRCVRTGEDPACGVDDAEQTLLLSQAVKRSAEAGAQWMDVEKGS